MRGFNMHLCSLRNMYSNRDLNGIFGAKQTSKPEDDIGTQVDAFAGKSSVSICKPLKLSNTPITRIEQEYATKSHEILKPEGPYKHTYPRKFKETVVDFAMTNGIKAACKKYVVTRKNVERWCKNGLDRKKGAGRKTTNPTMEVEILAWVEDYIRREGKLPKRNYIIIRAMEYADEAFKASKGWCDKFLKRNKSILETYLAEARSDESDDSDQS